MLVAGLVEALLPPSAPLMVMAPNNAVFDILDEDRLLCLLNPQYVLMYHMAKGEILAGAISQRSGHRHVERGKHSH